MCESGWTLIVGANPSRSQPVVTNGVPSTSAVNDLTSNTPGCCHESALIVVTAGASGHDVGFDMNGRRGTGTPWSAGTPQNVTSSAPIVLACEMRALSA
jgi:hypothetical protein